MFTIDKQSPHQVGTLFQPFYCPDESPILYAVQSQTLAFYSSQLQPTRAKHQALSTGEQKFPQEIE
jgi:hypothetical protein